MPAPASLLPQQKLERLRNALQTRGVDGFIIPICDEHMSEYVGAYAQRLCWLTGFNGSAGTGVVLADKAAIAVDGRYELQVRAQVPGALYTYLDIPRDSLGRWIAENAASGARIGYDPWLHDERWLAAMGKLLGARDIRLVPVTPNPIDAVWHDQPQPSEAQAFMMTDAAAGRSSADKRGQIIDWLKEKRLDATVMTALDSIGWTFNIRGADVSRTPVALAFALLHADGTTELFIDDAKLTPEVRAHLGNAVRTAPRFDIVTSLDALAGKRVAVDPERTVTAIIDRLGQSWVMRILWGAGYGLFYVAFATHAWQFALVPLHWLMGPIHGAIVNWCGHRYGYKNFDNGDQSRNTLILDFLTVGELFQNNHHKFGQSPNFAVRWFEIDPTYQVMRVLAWLGIIDFGDKIAKFRHSAGPSSASSNA